MSKKFTLNQKYRDDLHARRQAIVDDVNLSQDEKDNLMDDTYIEETLYNRLPENIPEEYRTTDPMDELSESLADKLNPETGSVSLSEIAEAVGLDPAQYR